MAGVDNGIGLGELADLPGKHQLIELVSTRSSLGYHLEILAGNHFKIGLLHQKSAVDALEVVSRLSVSQRSGF